MREAFLELTEPDYLDYIQYLYTKDGQTPLCILSAYGEICQWRDALLKHLRDISARKKSGLVARAADHCNHFCTSMFFSNEAMALFWTLEEELGEIRAHIDAYFPAPKHDEAQPKEETPMSAKTPKVFISHSSLDKPYVEAIVSLLEDLGLGEGQLFCSSVPGYGIPLDADIYDHLKEQFQVHDLHMIYVLSKNYYDSPACLNEMGAAWVLQQRGTALLLPGFEFQSIQGAIDPRKIGLKLDGDTADVKERLRELKENLRAEFGLSDLSPAAWERKRDQFLVRIGKI